MINRWKKVVGLAVLLATAPIAAHHMSLHHLAGQEQQQASAEQVVDAKADLGILQWPANLNAVRYSVQLLRDNKAIYENDWVHTNSVMLDMQALNLSPTDLDKVYWRIRAYDLDGKPITPYSEPKELTGFFKSICRNAPMTKNAYNQGNGTQLLYPVYSFTGNPGAKQFEIEVTDEYPENLDSIEPSEHRIYSDVTTLNNLYDKQPRTGTYYWRVRGMDKEGNPVGVWSLPQEMSLSTDGWEVAIYGDSISHGGGHLSFGPADFAYSYEKYLDFPSINLSESGDTSARMVERFEQDVLPFHPKYLLIMGGTNSLRGGVPAENVIEDLQAIQEKAKDHGMTPILMTLAPINPDNIHKAFKQDTTDNWQEAFNEVNAYIRTQRHIDTAAPFEQMGEELPTSMALDGLHGDWRMKREMANVINRDFCNIVGAKQFETLELAQPGKIMNLNL